MTAPNRRKSRNRIEIAELSDKVTFKEEDNTCRCASRLFLITNPCLQQGPRFAGSPLGHEFTSLVLALLWTGGHPSKEAQSLLEQIRDIDGDFELKLIIHSPAITARNAAGAGTRWRC